MTNLNAHEIEALQRFAATVTVPILEGEPPKTSLAGTGSFFRIENRYFLVTAAHVFDGVDLTNLWFPRTPFKDEAPMTLGDADLYRPPVPESDLYDIAVLEIKSDHAKRAIESGWSVLNLEDVGSPSNEGLFAVFGYPLKLMTGKGEAIFGRHFGFFTQRLDHEPKTASPPANRLVDLFFAYPQEVELIDGRRAQTPELKGVSGGPVFEYHEPSNGVWAPQKCMNIVGVQCSSAHGEHFRAKTWECVKAILKRIDPPLQVFKTADKPEQLLPIAGGLPVAAKGES